jgi:hypothetical protein
MTPEGRLLARLTKWLKQTGVRFIRLALQPGVKRGWPDLCILIPGGAPLFVELKAPGGETSEQQDLRIGELRDAGYAVQVHDAYDEAVAAILQALDARSLPASG